MYITNEKEERIKDRIAKLGPSPPKELLEKLTDMTRFQLRMKTARENRQNRAKRQERNASFKRQKLARRRNRT
jgi:hypothetical protein